MVEMRWRLKRPGSTGLFDDVIAGPATFLSFENQFGIRMSECQDSQWSLSPFAPDTEADGIENGKPIQFSWLAFREPNS